MTIKERENEQETKQQSGGCCGTEQKSKDEAVKAKEFEQVKLDTPEKKVGGCGC